MHYYNYFVFLFLLLQLDFLLVYQSQRFINYSKSPKAAADYHSCNMSVLCSFMKCFIANVKRYTSNTKCHFLSCQCPEYFPKCLWDY